MTFHYRLFQSESDMETYSIAIAEAFACDPAMVPEWVKKSGEGNIRIMELDGQLAGTCLFIPMGQFFGGCSVPMIGVAGVTVRPEFRGAGVAKTMMAEAVKEMASTGTALSSLYPSTMPLYQSVGYELAGNYPKLQFSFEHLPAARLSQAHADGLKIVPGGEADHAEIQQLYRDLATYQAGFLDRGDYIWKRIFEPREKKAATYVVRESMSGKLRGFISLSQDAAPDLGIWNEVNVYGIQASDPPAWNALFAFLRSYQSMARRVSLYIGGQHPLFLAMPEQRSAVLIDEVWMTRILNLKSSLVQRGYAAGLTAELHLEVSDDLISANHGHWILRVENGVAEVTPGGNGDLKIPIRSLAPLYTGHLSAEILSAAGRLQGTSRTLALATSIFQGPAPWMPDMF